MVIPAINGGIPTINGFVTRARGEAYGKRNKCSRAKEGQRGGCVNVAITVVVFHGLEKEQFRWSIEGKLKWLEQEEYVLQSDEARTHKLHSECPTCTVFSRT